MMSWTIGIFAAKPLTARKDPSQGQSAMTLSEFEIKRFEKLVAEFVEELLFLWIATSRVY